MSSSIMVDLDDSRIAKIADVISNKTAKKILNLLAGGEMNSSEIASKLGAPLNTILYNLKKLVDAGLVEKVNRIFWSSRGKRIEIYKLTNKSIVITPKKIVKGVLPTMIISGVAAFLVKFWIDSKLVVQRAGDGVASFAQEGARVATDTALEASSAGAAPSTSIKVAEEIVVANVDSVGATLTQGAVDSAVTVAQFSWVWFFIGSMFGILVYLLWNWGRK